MPTLLTARELAAEIQMNEKELYRKAVTGEIPSYKFGTSRRFSLQEVLQACKDLGPMWNRKGRVKPIMVKR